MLYIGSYAFRNCTSLEAFVFPNQVQLGVGVFDGCTSLNSIYILGEAPSLTNPHVSMPLLETCFANAASSDFKIFAMEENAETFKNSQTWQDNLSYVNFSYSLDNDVDVEDLGTDKMTLHVNSFASLLNVFAAKGNDTAFFYTRSSIALDEDILCEPVALDLEGLDDENVKAIAPVWHTGGVLTGSMEGNGKTISNAVARGNSLFTVIAEGATVSDVMLDKASIYVDPTDPRWEERNDTIYISLIASKNSGSVSNFGFAGRVVVDENKVPEGKTVAVCLVGDNEETGSISGFYYDTDLMQQEEGNKRCITIKQAIVALRNRGKRKVAKSKTGDNKTIRAEYEYTEEEINKLEREFTSGEFASGVVAYWLNWNGVGYTGEYTATWRQGKDYPELAIDVDGVSNGLYKVEYDVNDDRHIACAPEFANNGDKITIAYTERPKYIKIGDEEVELGESSATFTYDATKRVSIAFPTGVTSLGAAKAAGVRVEGRTITAPAGTTVYTLSGIKASGDLTPGLYIVKTPTKSVTVVVK